MNEVPDIQIHDAKKKFDQKDCMFVDLRDPASYRAAHIPGAVHLHDGNVQQFIESADKDRDLIVYQPSQKAAGSYRRIIALQAIYSHQTARPMLRPVSQIKLVIRRPVGQSLWAARRSFSGGGYGVKLPRLLPGELHCYHGNSSLGAVVYFLENGFKKAANMSGGFEAWRQVYQHEAG